MLLTPEKDKPWAVLVEGYGYVDAKAVAAVEQAVLSKLKEAYNFKTFEEWFESHGKHNAKKECNHVGVQHLMKLAWEVSRELKA